MSYQEFCSWVRFRNKRGTLHQGMRIERGFALLATIYSNRHLKQGVQAFKLTDFMPNEQERAISLQDAMKTWG